MELIKSPQNCIDAYLLNVVNIEIYEELIEKNCSDNESDVLLFFNELYSEFAFFYDNMENYLILKNHFKDYYNSNYDANKENTIVLYDLFDHFTALVKLIDEYFPNEDRKGVIVKSCDYIKTLLDQIYLAIGVDPMKDILSDIINLDYSDKITYLTEIKYISLKNEKLFIDSEGEKLSAKCDLEIERLKKIHKIKKPEKLPEIDLSDTNTVKKIIFLKELGVIDFLRTEQPFNTSVNSLATVLTAITGDNIKTIQPYLNALLSKTGAENNNPYKTSTTVEKVKNQLTSLGFKLK